MSHHRPPQDPHPVQQLQTLHSQAVVQPFDLSKSLRNKRLEWGNQLALRRLLSRQEEEDRYEVLRCTPHPSQPRFHPPALACVLTQDRTGFYIGCTFLNQDNLVLCWNTDGTPQIDLMALPLSQSSCHNSNSSNDFNYNSNQQGLGSRVGFVRLADSHPGFGNLMALGQGTAFVTGLYNGFFHVYDTEHHVLHYCQPSSTRQHELDQTIPLRYVVKGSEQCSSWDFWKTDVTSTSFLALHVDRENDCICVQDSKCPQGPSPKKHSLMVHSKDKGRRFHGVCFVNEHAVASTRVDASTGQGPTSEISLWDVRYSAKPSSSFVLSVPSFPKRDVLLESTVPVLEHSLSQGPYKTITNKCRINHLKSLDGQGRLHIGTSHYCGSRSFFAHWNLNMMTGELHQVATHGITAPFALNNASGRLVCTKSTNDDYDDDDDYTLTFYDIHDMDRHIGLLERSKKCKRPDHSPDDSDLDTSVGKLKPAVFLHQHEWRCRQLHTLAWNSEGTRLVGIADRLIEVPDDSDLLYQWVANE